MATGLPSAHPPYKRMIDGDISDYICSECVPSTVHDEPFVLRKPGDMKITHLDAWLTLLRDRQEKYLRREVDHIFRFVCTKARPVLKPAVYDPDFMKAYALEHGPMYEANSSQAITQTVTVNPANPANESQASHETDVDGPPAENRLPSSNEVLSGTRSLDSHEVPSETRSSDSDEVPLESNHVGSTDYEEDDQQVDDYLAFEGDGTGRSELSPIHGALNEEDGSCIHDIEVGEVVC